MEWHGGRALKQDSTINDTGSSSRVLTTTSGNAQLFSNDPKHDLLPSSSLSSSHNVAASSLSSSAYVRPTTTTTNTTTITYPTPTTTLRSNDHHTSLQSRLKLRKLQVRNARAKRCWTHPAYLKYLARPRKDVDKATKEIIWSEDVERAFRNAVVNIPAMGRSKKSQHGRACGRNELFTEWIIQETGKKRVRKQISSHLQVFDHLFKDLPEWAALNKISKTPGIDDMTEDDEHEYYSNSIADMVRSWRTLQNTSQQHDTDLLDIDESMSEFPAFDLLPLSEIEFDMWVSQPDNLHKVLHRYTKIQCHQPTVPPEPLENVPDWRARWPDLVALVDGASSSSAEERFDIALLETSCQLMQEFPPPRSKLGISLELRFSSSNPNAIVPDDNNPWSCVSHFYQRGQVEKSFRYGECHLLGPGRVKPPFESKWWAEKFSALTERRVRARDSKNDAAIAVADEAARNYLHNLTVLQQISAAPHYMQQDPKEGLDGPANKHRRIAVLLWSFSQTAGDFVGATTWRKLLPPPRRIDVNSPLPSAIQLGLPPLTIDSTLDIPPDEILFDFTNTFPSARMSNGAYQPHLLGGSYQDEFVAASQRNHQSYEDTGPYENTSHINGVPAGFQHVLDLQFGAQPPRQPPGMRYSTQIMGRTQSALPDKLFGASQEHVLPSQPPHSSHYDYQMNNHIDDMYDAEHHHTRRLPLMNFDLNTHRVLQVQLQNTQDDGQSAEHAPQALLRSDEGLNQGSSELIRDLTLQGILTDEARLGENSHHQKLEPQFTVATTTNNEAFRVNASNDTGPLLLAPTASRPPLLHHHSFTGVTQGLSEQNIGFSDHLRHDFMLLLENLEANRQDVVEAGRVAPTPDMIQGLEITRPHTQPPLLAALIGQPRYDEVENMHAMIQPQPVGDVIDDKLEATLAS